MRAARSSPVGSSRSTRASTSRVSHFPCPPLPRRTSPISSSLSSSASTTSRSRSCARAQTLPRSARSSRRPAPQAWVIAKIELKEAVNELDAILDEADAVMIARGDLGVEIGVAEVPLLQKRIILAALEHGKPAITATQMLETMIGRPEPTRAEASDVANAILDGTSAVMLSAETAVGTYPVEAVETMDRIARAVEPSLGYRHQLPSASEAPTVGRAMSNAACDLAEALGAKAILVPTFTGRTASAVARLRPRRPIVALTHVVVSLQHMAIEWGVTPLEIPEATDVEDLWRNSIETARARRHRRDRRPGRADGRHRREHPGLDERHQGRDGLDRVRHGRGGDRGPDGNLLAWWRPPEAPESGNAARRVRSRDRGACVSCSPLRSSPSPHICTTSRSRRTSRRRTSSPNRGPRSTPYERRSASSISGSRSRRARRRLAAKRGASATSGRASSSTSSRGSRTGDARTCVPSGGMDDLAIVERQLGSAPRAFRRVAVRCPHGTPAVTEQDPYSADGEPFPTTYYLTCQRLVAAIARIEAAGGVERWSRDAAQDPALAASLEQATQEQRRDPARARCRADRSRRWRVARARDRRLAVAGEPQVPPCARRFRARTPRVRARRADACRGRSDLAGRELLHRRARRRTRLGSGGDGSGRREREARVAGRLPAARAGVEGPAPGGAAVDAVRGDLGRAPQARRRSLHSA